MAETLTYDNTPETEVLTPDEQDSLEIGEQMVAEQEGLLAGKYKTAEDLEKGYLELQGKLGGPPIKDAPEESSEEEEEVEDTTNAEFLDRLWDEATSNKYTDETLKELGEMNPRDLAQMHLEYRSKNQQEKAAPQLTTQNVAKLKEVAGGEDQYEQMVGWAKNALGEQEIAMFDKVMESGDTLSCYFAIQALKYRYDDASGVEGKMLTGKAPSNSRDGFSSQAQVVEAMSDPKYDKDPAYRKEIMDKLERSNLQF